MDKKYFDYVISASSRLRLFDKRILETYYDVVKDPIVNLMEFTKEKVKKECIYIDPRISVLYNGFTEPEYTEYYKKLNNLGCDYVYADSGGLQIVTLDKKITSELKEKVYENQMYSSYAMCFDNIPLERTTIARNSVERLITDNKIFNQDRHAESGSLTGKNIKEQIDCFRKNKANTKVIMIVQGNQADDMVLYFNKIIEQLDPSDYEYIGGLAVADTCMGNATLESIEMLRAARRIAEIAPHENIKNHLHFLGVGTINRLRPIIYLLRSKYLDSYKHISYDSSTVSSTYDFGKAVIHEKTIALGQTKTQEAINYFNVLYDFYADFFKPLVDRAKYHELVFGIDHKDEVNYQCWKNSTICKRVDKLTDKKEICAALLVRPAYLYYQIQDFIIDTDKVFVEKPGKIKSNAVSQLLKVEDDVMMDKWMSNHAKYVPSKRIKRKENISNVLEDFFV